MKQTPYVAASVFFATCCCLPLVDLRGADPAPNSPPKSSAPGLEQAAEALAENRLDVARTGFEAVLSDAAAPAFVRALAYIGSAETALAQKDVPSALAIWKRQAADEKLSRFHRDLAAQRLLEADRAHKDGSVVQVARDRPALPAMPSSGVTFHVAPSGSDADDGSSSRPFASIERARDAIRALKKDSGGVLPAGGFRVVLGPGDYPVRQTLKLTAEDSGAPGVPLVIQSQRPSEARLRGGVQIKGWQIISDSEVKARLSPAAARAVLEADLKSLGLRDWGDATTLRERPELFVNGAPQTLARWPNEGFVKTGEILGTNTFKVWNSIPGCKDGRFSFVEDRPRAWLDEPDVRLYGYWFWDWYEEFQKVASIDAADRSFALAEPWSQYGYRKDQRYYALNVFSELDQPGEWYLDRRAARLYWLPPAGFQVAQADAVLSMFEAPFIELRDAQHVVLLGLTLQEGRGDGIHVSGGNECLIAGCSVRRMGGDGVVISGGKKHGIFGCLIETMGCGGTRVAGGHRDSLEPGLHFVENCTVRDISRLKRTYAPAVHLDGCGNRIAHNLFENIPSSAVRIEGNDHLIELNHIRDVVKESDDQGGVDMFGNPLYRGVVIRWNRWSDIRGGTHTGAAGVRLDDMISGIAVYGNLFERCGSALFGGVQIHGGKDNLVDNNLFVDCFAGISFSRWGEKRWLESISRFVDQAAKTPYAARYPELATLKTGADVNDISRNVFVRCGPTFLRDGGVPRTALNAVVSEPLDAKALTEPGLFRTNRIFRSRLFEPIPLPEIGPYDHPWCVPPLG